MVSGGRPEYPASLNLTYQYYGDGRIKYIQNHVNRRFDRLYKYDHLGRLTEALSGIEAGGTGASVEDSPYKETFQYDVWLTAYQF
jgi:ribosome modulation factor